MPATESAAPARVYVDTSALVALVTAEPRTASLKAWLRGHGKAALVSADWCVPEVASALSIKVRTRSEERRVGKECVP